jgi:TRAP-type C4-dicarboxylate transport system permease small subunit
MPPSSARNESDGFAPRTAGHTLLAGFDRFLRLLGALSALGLLLLPVLVAADVFMRNLSGHTIPWHDDVCEYLLYVSTMLAAPWLLHLGRHVRIDVLPGLLREQASRRLEQAINALMLGVCGVLVFHGVTALQNAVNYQTMLYKALTVPVWPFIALFIGSICIISLELMIRIATGRGAHEDVQVHI